MDAIAVSEINNSSQQDETVTVPKVNNGPDPGENKFSRAISAWRAINLSSLIPQLDSTVSEIVANQRDALVERKEVAQKTKDFRKLDDSAKLTEYKALLKSYQTFIDLLTGHGKTSSSAFLQLYTSFSDAPDPFPLLEASVDSLVLSEDTVPRLTVENEELQRTVGRLTSQLENTESRLRDEISARKAAESGSGAKVEEIEAKWSKVLEEKQNNWEAKERSLEEKVENQERLLKELKASYEVAQRLGHDDQTNAMGKANSVELEMISSELEKATTRLAEVEARNEQFSLELAKATAAATSSRAVEDDPGYLRLQSENSSLLRKIESIRLDRNSEQREWQQKMRQSDRQRSQVTEENEDLRNKVQKWADYDEIQRELEMIKSIEFSTGADDELGDEQLNGAAVGDKDKSTSLEQLLLGRNKKLSHDLTLLRVSHRDLQQQLEDLQEELSNTNADLEKSQKLSSTLENDLLKLQEESSNALPSSGASIAGTYVSRYPQSSRRGRASPTSSIISGFDNHRSSAFDGLRSPEGMGGGSGILPMIQAQRDRFKQKNQQLEEELSKTYATVTSLRQEVASLQKDNLNLYEKSRYVSAYSRNTHAGSGGSYSSGLGQGSILPTDESSDTTSGRWKSQYEANISPYAAFQGREATRAYKKMTLPERIIFSFTRIVLSTRTSRNLFAAYCMALHLLVFIMLYMMGTTTVERHATHLGEAAAGVLARSLTESTKQDSKQ